MKQESTTEKAGRAEPTLSDQERRLLTACCECEEGKGVPVGKEWKRVANSLTRKGLAWTLSSIFTVCIATDAGRAALSKAKGASS
jgi:hypothetical protein